MFSDFDPNSTKEKAMVSGAEGPIQTTAKIGFIDFCVGHGNLPLVSPDVLYCSRKPRLRRCTEYVAPALLFINAPLFIVSPKKNMCPYVLLRPVHNQRTLQRLSLLLAAGLLFSTIENLAISIQPVS